MIFTVLDFLEKTAKRLPNKMMVSDGKKELSFQEVNELSTSIAKLLKRLEILAGDRVGICMTKSSEQLISILGCLYANAIFVPILPALKSKGISHIIKNSGMKPKIKIVIVL
jgi:acyl-CoA synthetase (AMP-forming)/AMP-acid ligase II